MNKDAVQIQFLTFDGCPLAPAAQEVLEKALVQCGLKGRYEVVDIFDAATPARLLAWGRASFCWLARHCSDGSCKAPH